jgi:hypothetical protein
VEYTHASGGVILFDRIEPQKHQIRAWVELRVNGSGEPLRFGGFDLTSHWTPTNLTKNLPASSIPWDEIVPRAVYAVIREQMDGEPPVRLGDLDTGDSAGWLLEPLVEGNGATLLVAAGGSAKSYLCLAAAVSVATGKPVIGDLTPNVIGPVLYLDWEADDKTHAARFQRICRGVGLDVDIPVHYRRESQPLARTVHQVAQICDDYDVAFLVVDSVMLARGGDAFGPEATAALFAAIRELGRPALLADHKSRQTLSKGKSGAYGSVVGENSARRVWDVGGSFDEPGHKIVRLENTKANNSEKHEPIAVEFTWTDDGAPSVTIGLTTPAVVAVTNVDRGGRHWQSIQTILGSSDPLTVAELQEQLNRVGIDMTDGTIRKILSRGTDRFKNVGTQHKGVWTTLVRNQDLFSGAIEGDDEPPAEAYEDEGDEIF